MTYRDLRGAIHVHTRYSSDSEATVEDMLAAARECALDFVVLTDDGNPTPHEIGLEGYHDGVLLIVGAEIGSRKLPHLVTVGMHETRRLSGLSVEDCLVEIERRGGRAFVAHPRGKKLLTMHIPPWTAWESDHYAGIEFWSYMHDWIRDFRWRRIIRFLRHPHEQITGPHPEVLAAWDRVASRRHVSGIVGLDAHVVSGPFGWPKVFPYNLLFRTTLTHVLVPEGERPSSRGTLASRPEGSSGSGGRVLRESASEQVAAVTEALVRGRAFGANHVVGDPAGFRCFAVSGERQVEMGEEVTLNSRPVLKVSLPAVGVVRLVALGEVVSEASGREAEFPLSLSGPHRVEVRRDGKPWIFGNHIYVT